MEVRNPEKIQEIIEYKVSYDGLLVLGRFCSGLGHGGLLQKTSTSVLSVWRLLGGQNAYNCSNGYHLMHTKSTSIDEFRLVSSW